MSRWIQRGYTHIIANKQGGIFSICPVDETMLVAHIRQITVVLEDGVVSKRVAEAVIVNPIDQMLDMKLHKGALLPCNIVTEDYTDPIDVDNPMENLLDELGPDDQFIWRVSYYSTSSPYNPHGEIDSTLATY